MFKVPGTKYVLFYICHQHTDNHDMRWHLVDSQWRPAQRIHISSRTIFPHHVKDHIVYQDHIQVLAGLQHKKEFDDISLARVEDWENHIKLHDG